MATILIVDDEPSNRELFVTLLGYAGHRTLEASDAVEALQAMRMRQPDLVISDILMPAMSGYEFVRQARSEPGIATIPIVLSSAHFRDPDAAALAKTCGVSFLLPKPCDPAEVLRTVNAALAAERPLAPPSDNAFDREHLRLLTNELAQKVQSLQAANELLTKEITEREQTQTALKASEERLRAIVDTAIDAIVVIDQDAIVQSFNPAAERIFGYRASEVVGNKVGLLMPEPHRAAHDGYIGAYRRTGIAKIIGVGREIEGQRKDGTTFPIDLSVAEWSIAGKRFFTGIMRDITKRKQAEEHVRFVMRELSHRTKNVLAVVQAMAWQTARTSVDLEDFDERFTSRVLALTTSQNLLAKREWQGIALADLVHAQLAPFLDRPDERVAAQGPALVLRPEAAQSLGLALHELATNASKYGALSHPTGRIEIGWTVDPDIAAPYRFNMSWRETVGIELNPPKRNGFGHTVIKDITAKALDGKVTIAFMRQGFVWQLAAPTHSMFRDAAGGD